MPESGPSLAELPMKPVETTDKGRRYLGVEVEGAKDRSSPLIPKPEVFSKIVDNKATLELKRTLALTMRNGESINLEGISGYGKSTIPKQMASELGYQVYEMTGNGFKRPDELEDKFAPAFTEEPGAKKMVLIHESNAIDPNVMKAMNEYFDAHHSKDTVVIFTSNPATADYKGIVPPGADQARRVPTYRLPDSLEPSDKRFYGKSLWGGAPEVPEGITEESYIISRDEPLTLEEVIDKFPESGKEWDHYIEFDIRVQQMLKDGTLTNNVNGEPVIFGDYTMPPKIQDFVFNFCPEGATSIIPTLQTALKYYYASRFEYGSHDHELITKEIESLGGDQGELPDPKEHRDEDWTK